MGALDVILLAVMIIAAVTGAMKGFVGQLGTIAGLVLGILVCRFYGDTVVAMIVDPQAQYAAIYKVIVLALMFILVFLSVSLVASLFGSAMSKLHIRIVDRIGGAILRVFTWTLLLSIVLNVYFAIAPADLARFDTPGKPWRHAIVRLAPKTLAFITT